MGKESNEVRVWHGARPHERAFAFGLLLLLVCSSGMVFWADFTGDNTYMSLETADTDSMAYPVVICANVYRVVLREFPGALVKWTTLFFTAWLVFYVFRS